MGVLFLGACFHVFENLMRKCGVVVLMGYVSMCVLVMCFNTCGSSCGVCRLVVGFVWL